jgi:hypothetical protein
MPLIFRCINPEAPTIFAAVSYTLVVGRVRKSKTDWDRWDWSLNVIGPSYMVASRGDADDLDRAKRALSENWQRRLDLAGLREVP